MRESLMYQSLYEMAYQTMQDYGKEFAVSKAVDATAAAVEKEDIFCFVLNEEGEYMHGKPFSNRQEIRDAIFSVLDEVDGENTYAYGIRKIKGEYYLIHICETQITGEIQYLGFRKDLSKAYTDRRELLNQYRLALCLLLLAGGGIVFGLSRWIAKPIRNLGRVAGRIASGNLEERSRYKVHDEIGVLAASFNRMADRLVEQMHEKEQEAQRKEDFTAAFAHELKTPLTSIIGYASPILALNVWLLYCRLFLFARKVGLDVQPLMDVMQNSRDLFDKFAAIESFAIRTFTQQSNDMSKDSQTKPFDAISTDAEELK